MDRSLRAALSSGFVLLLALYLAFPDRVYVFDGIQFAGVIERGVDEWRRELFNRRHLLFNPLLMLLRDGLALLHLKVTGYALIQRVNAVLGAVSLALFVDLLRRRKVDLRLAAASALLLGATFTFMTRATEGQVYMFLTTGCLATLWACALGDRRLVAALFAVAVLFHAAAVVLAPAVFVAAGWIPVVVAGVLVAVPYIWAFHLTSWPALMAFLGRASEMQMQGEATVGGIAGKLFTSGGLSPFERAKVVLEQLFSSLAAHSLTVGAAAAGGLALLGLAIWAGRRGWLAWWLAFAGFVFLNAFWMGGLFFWAVPWACLIAAVVEAKRPRWEAVTAVAAALLGWNVWRGLYPASRLENNVGYTRSVFVRDHTVASSWIVISGVGFPNSKVYLPYFARRSREVLEYYLDRNAKPEALAKFSGFVARNEQMGIPLYLLSDLVDDRRALGYVEKTWGVTPADIRGAFGPGRPILMAQQDDGFRVYLFVPAQLPQPLFAVLSYSVLTENEPQRLQETAAALKQIGELMTPAQRETAAKLMAATDYGAALLMSGFGPYMSPESRAAAQKRVALFHEWQKTPDFHLRLGNLYRYLGQTALVRREWTAAYKLTGDAGLKKQLELLK